MNKESDGFVMFLYWTKWIQWNIRGNKTEDVKRSEENQLQQQEQQNNNKQKRPREEEKKKRRAESSNNKRAMCEQAIE